MSYLPLPRPPARLRPVAVVAAVLSVAACADAPNRPREAAIAPSVSAAPSYASIEAAVRTLLARPTASDGIDAASYAALRAFYDGNGYAPVWVTADGLQPRGLVLLAALARVREALAPAAQPLLAALEGGRGATGTQARAELELRLSRALLEIAVSPVDPTAGDMPRVLPDAVATADTARFLAERLPANPAFWRLRDAIRIYREIAARGGWQTLPPGSKLEPGSHDPRVAAVRARLLTSGDLPSVTGQSDLYDEELRQAVVRFQTRHGLAPDGVVGAGTLAALNVPVEARLATMRANLRRLQHETRDWGDSYLVVNIPAATYRLVEDGQPVFENVTIVGQPDWPTPEVDSQIERIEFNPFWTVPPRIARLELLPKIRQDPEYLARHNMRQVAGMYRQDPGADNALGRVKFLFPNPHAVYLHDTNSPRLFQRQARYLSHGCVRVSNALDLAERLLEDEANWSREEIAEVLRRGKNRQATLSQPMPIHLVYDTAWVDDAGTVNFRDDIYGRDGTAAGAG